MSDRAPPARTRLPWRAVAPSIRSEIERRLGWSVAEATDLSGGFSPGAVAELRSADGRAAFVKAVSTDQNPDSPSIARRERRVASALPEGFPAPRLLHGLDDGHWVALVYEHIDADNPIVPWRPDQLDDVVASIAGLAQWVSPSPVDGLASLTDTMAEEFSGWRRLAAGGPSSSPDGPDLAEDWIQPNLDRLAEVEAGWDQAAAGTSLVHLDLRSDNLLIDGEGKVWFVDWAHGSIGAAWVDLVFLLPSVAMEGGPDPERAWTRSPFAAIDAEAVTAVVAAVAGFFTYQARLPPPPGLPTLRAFQEAQGVWARRWLRTRLGL